MNNGRHARVIRFIVRLGLMATGMVLLVTVSGNAQDKRPAESPTPPDFRSTLSEQERAWLRDHPVISVAQDPSWPPIEFADERGTPTGMTADYLSLVEQRLGVKFQRVEGLSWQEAYARMKRREIDMTTTVTATPERETFWAFTKPYMTIPLVIVTRSDVAYIADLSELEGKKVIVVAGYIAESFLARDFPNIPLVATRTTEEGLAMLQRGEGFAFIDNMLVVDRFIATSEMSDLKITGITRYENAQRMAVRKDWAILAGILDQALDSISVAERDAIYRKWLPVHRKPTFDYGQLWAVVAILGVALLALAAWNRRMAVEIRYREQADAALRSSESRWKFAVEGSGDGLWDWDVPASTVFFTKRWKEMLGFTDDEVGTGLEEWSKRIHPDDLARTMSDVQAHLAGTTPVYACEHRVRCKDGSWKWILDRGLVVERDAAGQPLRMIGTHSDISERKQAAQAQSQSIALAERARLAMLSTLEDQQLAAAALKASEFRYQLLFDNAPFGVFRSTPEGAFESVNPALARMLGYSSPAEAIRSVVSIADQHFAEPAERRREQDAARSKGQFVLSEQRFRRVDGTTWIGLVNARTVFDASGTPRYYEGFIEDISARKQAETDLRDSEAELRVRNAALTRFNDVTVGRELRMIELKREVNALRVTLGESPRYGTVALAKSTDESAT